MGRAVVEHDGKLCSECSSYLRRCRLKAMGMFKSVLALALFLAGAGSLPAVDFDRSALHEEQLGVRQPASRANTDTRIQSSATASPLSTDFRLSDINSPAMFTQDNGCLKFLSNGNWLTVWQDERLGAYKIFLQKIDSTGATVGANQVTATSTVGADLVEPEVKTDTLGRIYLFYRDRGDGLVYGSRFNPDFSVDLTPFPVNDTTAAAFAGPYDFDVYPDGRCVVAWENYSTGGSSVQMRIYSAAGSSLYGPSTVNSDVGTVSHWVPAVAVQPGSGFVVAWEDYRNSQPDIYARQFNGSGSPVASEFGVVPPGPSSSNQYAPRISYSSVDQYVIAWVDQRTGQEIYLQRFDPISGAVGSNQLVSSGDSLVTNWDLDVAVSPQGKFLMTWGSYGAENLIVSRRFGTGVVAAGTIETKNQSVVGRRWAPSAAFQRANRYGIAWTEYLNGDANINLMLYDTLNSKLLGAEKRLNDDTQGAPAQEPSIAAAEWRLELVAFTSRRHDDGDIYVQCISHAGIPIYSNQRVNQDSGYTLQSEPNVVVKNNKSLVVWVDSRSLSGNSGQRIFGRIGTYDGLFSAPDFAVSDSLQAAIKTGPSAAMASSGRALVCWIDKRDGTPQVYGRWLTSAGALDGAEFAISTPASDLRNSDLYVAADSVGRFYVVWLDDGVTPVTVKGKWYNANKSAGGSFSYHSDVSGVAMEHLAVAVNDSGLISMAWVGVGAASRGIYTTTITRTGTISISTLEATDSPVASPTDPSISVDENSYKSIAWLDYRNGTAQAYFQMYDNDAAALGTNQPVSSTVPEFMATPIVSSYRGRVWFVWSDPRQYGLQIYGNNSVYLPTAVDEDKPQVPTSFSLGQNYPNPFNPSTEIKFALPRRLEISLTVFDLLGQTVKVIAGGTLEAGEHRVRWDGTDQNGMSVASGIYFYRLEAAGFSQSRKMILLK